VQQMALRTLIGMLFAAIVCSGSAASATDSEGSKSSSVIMMYINQVEAYQNAKEVTLSAPPIMLNGAAFVPLKDLPHFFDMTLTEDLPNKRVLLNSEQYLLELEFRWNAYFFNGEPSPFRQFIVMQNEQAYVHLKRLSRMFNFQITYEGTSQKITMIYMPGGSFNAELYKSMPIAKFRTGKSTYRIGEPIDYLNLSYSPTGQTIIDTIWQGRQNVYYEPGEYTITLRVKDKNKQESLPFSRKITVSSEVMYTPLQHFAFLARPGTNFKLAPIDVAAAIKNFNVVNAQSVPGEARTLLVSDSPEDIRSPGILYDDRTSGKVRLFANHVNASAQALRFAILATNEAGTDAPLRMTNKGESVPSGIANLNGKRALLDFMLNEHLTQSMLVPAGKTIVLAKLPLLAPREGVNVIYDCETAVGDFIRYSFVALPAATDFNQLTAEQLSLFSQLEYRGHVRGTFSESERIIQVEAPAGQVPQRLTIGDNKIDLFSEGFDATRKLTVRNKGNFGMMYRMTVKHEQRIAVAIRARGGMFKGHMLFDGNLVFIPNSGVLTPQDGLQLLYRTNNESGQMLIEFSPPAGSAFPIDLVFFPLNDKIKFELK
jgi:hypothetical protein